MLYSEFPTDGAVVHRIKISHFIHLHQSKVLSCSPETEIFNFFLFIPKEASVTSLQTITDNLMDLRESALLMRNPERYSPSTAA